MSRSNSSDTLDRTLRKQRFAEKIMSFDDEQELLEFFMGILDRKGYITLTKKDYDADIEAAKQIAKTELHKLFDYLEEAETELKAQSVHSADPLRPLDDRAQFFEDSRNPPKTVHINGEDFYFEEFSEKIVIDRNIDQKDYLELVREKCKNLAYRALSDGYISYKKSFDPKADIIYGILTLTARKNIT